MDQLKRIKEDITVCISGQLSKLNEVDTKELGEAIDMIKDLSEAIYYCTITEAMEGKEKKSEHHYYMEPMYRDMDKDKGRMYYNEYATPTITSSSGNMKNYSEREYVIPMRDSREGRSPMSRKMYMETKEMKADKATIMKELEKYVQELTNDMVEMIADASPEERHYLEKRITALASKIGQMNG